MKRIVLAFVFLVCATAAHAQTSTPTVTPTQTPTMTATVTPTLTATSMPTGKPRVRSNVISDNATLLSAATSTGAGAAYNVRNYTTKTVQVTVGPVCTSYTLLVEGYVSGPSWATLATITESTIAAGATGVSTSTAALEYIRVRVSAISSCTLSAYLEAVP